MIKDELQKIYDLLKDNYLHFNPESTDFRNNDARKIDKLIERVSQITIDQKYFGFTTYKKNNETGKFEKTVNTNSKKYISDCPY